MNIPKNINQAIIAIWLTLGISAITAVINKQMGDISSIAFTSNLIIYGICCVFPYKIAKRSNSMRYIFTIITVIGYLIMIGGVTAEMTKLDIALSIILIPANIFIIYRLFNNEGNNWFAEENK